MSVDYQAAIWVGLPRAQLIRTAGEDCDIRDLIDAEDLETCPPRYDGGDEDRAIVGFGYSMSGVYSPSEFAWDPLAIDGLLAKFKDVTGVEGKVWLSPYGF